MSPSSESSLLRLDSYLLEAPPPQPKKLRETGPGEAPTPIRITLHGRGFKVIASDPKIMIGNVQLKDYEIMSDEATIIGYLHEIPEEGAVVSIDYGRGVRAELPERFSLSKLSGNGSPTGPTEP